MPDPSEILSESFSKVISREYKPLEFNPEIESKIDFVCNCSSNRAGIRLLLACSLAKAHDPDVDPTKPYTEIGGVDCFSGRTYDERYIQNLIIDNELPCNSTTAFLTPALRNIDLPLSTDVEIVGRPRQLYTDSISLLHEIKQGSISATDLLDGLLYRLIEQRDKKKLSLAQKLEELQKHSGDIILSSEETIALIEQHLLCRNSSRLPVIIIAAAYKTIEEKFEERIKPLLSHNAADEQTGSLGDVEICLLDDNNVRTTYEMKMKKVLRSDIDIAVQKIIDNGVTIDNYIFITTEEITVEVIEYAKSMYEKLGQREIAILDCIGFLRHFLHLFHRYRKNFIDEYQKLLLNEPESAVRHELKEVFLQLRLVAESK